MSKLVPIGLGAAAVIAVLFLGSQFIGSRSSNVGGPASQPPASVAPSVAPASAAPGPASEAPSAPPLTQSFTSPLHGISMSYPEGWVTQAATEPWTDGEFPFDFQIPQADFLHGDGFNLNLVFASQPLGDATPADWVAEQMAGPEGCDLTEPITVDGASGLIGASNLCKVVVVTTDGRGYFILAGISSDDPSNATTYDRAWFEEVLATVDLRPEDAVDAAP